MSRKQREIRAEDLLIQFGLKEAGRRKFGGYSKAMKRKLIIAAGIIHKPSILFLDEPTGGIGVASARQIRRLLADLNAAGTTIFLTTHYIEEAERLCERIAFIVDGKIVAVDTVENLMRSVQGRYVMHFEVSGDTSGLCEALEQRFPDAEDRPDSDGSITAESASVLSVGPIVRALEHSDTGHAIVLP